MLIIPIETNDFFMLFLSASSINLDEEGILAIIIVPKCRWSLILVGDNIFKGTR